MSALHTCAACGAAIMREPLEEASLPWRHVDVEDRRVSTCEGATLLAWDDLVRVDNDPESDETWEAFVEVNIETGLDLDSLAEIEEALVRCGRHVGFHDADVVLVSKIPALVVEDAVAAAPIERVRDFVGDFWDHGAPDGSPDDASDHDVRAFAIQVITDGLEDGNVTLAMVPTLFGASRAEKIEETPLERSTRVGAEGLAFVLGHDVAPHALSLLDAANVLRFHGDHGAADLAITLALRAAERGQ